MNRTLLLAFSLIPFANAIAGPSESNVPEKPAMLFIENRGQVQGPDAEAHSDILYQLSGNGVNVSLSRNAIYYTFYHGTAGQASPINQRAANTSSYEVEGMDMQLLGANPDPEIISGHEQGYYENYYSAARDDGKMEHLRSFERITYHEVYPGIDLVVHAPQDENATLAKLEFIVHEGANPGSIHIRYGRNAVLSIESDGSLLAEHAGNKLTASAPYAFIRETGDECAVQYRLDGNVVSLAAGKKASGTLVIVPRILCEIPPVPAEAEPVSESSMFRGEAFQVRDIARMGDLVSTNDAGTHFSPAPAACLSGFSDDGKLLWKSWFSNKLRSTAPTVAIDTNEEIVFVSQLSAGSEAGRPGVDLFSNPKNPEGFVAMFDLGGTLIRAGVYGKTSGGLITKAETTVFQR